MSGNCRPKIEIFSGPTVMYGSFSIAQKLDFFRRLRLHLRERSMPRERGAFHAGGEGVDARESGQLVEVGRRFAAGEDVLQVAERGLDLVGCLALGLRGHDGGAGLRDGAAGALEADGGDASVVTEAEVDG